MRRADQTSEPGGTTGAVPCDTLWRPRRIDGDDERFDRYELAPARDVVRWACLRFGAGLSVVTSFQHCVLVDLATRVDPGVEFVFLDTGAHFPETLAFVEQVRARYELNLRIVGPDPCTAAPPCGSADCCERRKVLPLARALEGRSAWMTGIKRVDTVQRSRTATVGWDARHGAVKVNPLARWSEADVAAYEADHGLPVHPLKARGYRSIGCAPTTRPVGPTEDARAGRWPGSEKTECGIHC